ncbi:aminotransferase class III-fold pyridoxal phosphate-dependent enzyme [Flavihumibacter fluvii]|uniref:aminotransferase class III-fold pyridoxal phosphate-dependent enzyme n=1 Tax=Flavihumibacter fluvii TaxID=2838157 RepID=UPI001BDE6C70|nr:aminotransferase class III-fold pyridoxal phosphate-dependent enzyme [Flavihumibacter fluvii]ULQ50851.1 aminotransferase class III-fold pyridoxal phosphate-dependent enzyme [Flavihumibacter fluvii]
MYIATDKLAVLLAEHYQLEGDLQALNGYEEQNVLLTDKQGKKFIVKISNALQDPDFLQAQVAILQKMSESEIAQIFQQLRPNNLGAALTPFIENGEKLVVRVLNFLEGQFLVELPVHDAPLLYSIGEVLGKMDRHLSSFRHMGMHRHYEWDISNTMDAAQNLDCINDPEKRRIAKYFLLQFEMEVVPKLPYLRKAYIHSDANDYNVLVAGGRMSGLIDFGDMVYSALINNLAVAATYAMLDKENPLAAAVEVVKGYDANYPLKSEEIDLLYYLIAGRLCISVGKSAYNASLDSENEHHFITEGPAWKLLYQLIEINPLKARMAFRTGCGYPPEAADPGYNHLLQDRKQYVGRNLSISYQKKLKIVKGALQYLYDDLGNTYIDCVNNVSHIGHCHPVLVKAMQKQLAVLNTNTRYLNDHLVDYAKKLTATLPSKLSVCYFTNSGSEANDLAIRMSRHFTKQQDVIVLDHAYHGTSTTAIEMSPYKFDGKGGFPQKPYIHKALNPDTYRGVYRSSDKDAGEKYAADVERIIRELAGKGKKPAAFICETLLGVGGQIPLPKGYLQRVYEYVSKSGGINIADEVQVGFGRVGECFWGFELQEVVPDIVVMGKPIGNGHPLAAVVVTAEIADAFNNGMEYFNTYGGNPVSMVTGKTVLEIIQQEELQAHALETGNHLMDGLRRLMDKHPIIGDVRGHGLFIGAELVKDRNTLEPAVPEIDTVVEAMRDRGFLISTDGPLYNVLKIKPPLVFNKKNADELVNHLDEILSSLALVKLVQDE